MKITTLTLALTTLIAACSGVDTQGSLIASDGKDGRDGDAGPPGVAGPAGEAGPPGERGPAGASGNDALLGKISTTWQCDFSKNGFGQGGSGPPTGCTDSMVKVNVWYYAAEMASGDTLVRVGVDSITPGRSEGGSSSYLWPAGTDEAVSGMNWLLQDVCSGGLSSPNQADVIAYTGNWSFSLNKAGRVLTTTYADKDVSGGALTFTSPCTVRNF